MKRELPAGLARENLVVLGVGLTAMALFVLFWLVPTNSGQQRVVEEIDAAQAQLDATMQLASAHRALEARLAKLREAKAPPLAERSPLPAPNIGEVLPDCERLAKATGVQIISLDPKVTTGPGPIQVLTVESSFRGGLEDHRQLLLGLLQLPYVDRLERVTIAAGEKGLELRVLFFVNVT